MPSENYIFRGASPRRFARARWATTGFRRVQQDHHPLNDRARAMMFRGYFMRVAILVMFGTLCTSVAYGQPSSTQLEATIESSLLTEVESTFSATRDAVEKIEVDDLGVTYKDGKQLEALRQIVLDWSNLGFQHVANTRRSPGVEATVALLTGLSELRIGVRDLSSELGRVGVTSKSPAAFRAAIPLIGLVTPLDKVSSKLGSRVHEITVAADEALRN